MTPAEPLPERLAERYRAWRRSTFEEDRASYDRLAREGQRPEVMIVACCDSRVLVSEMFGGKPGDYFVHRNIAAFVPPPQAPEGAHGTLSTIEFAVTALGVRHILVVGHSRCGGVAGCHDLCAGAAPELGRAESYLGAWLRLLAPCYEAVRHLPDREARLAAMEREAVAFSVRNLAALPFVAAARADGRLSLHGAWKDVGGETLEVLDPAQGRFVPLPL